MMARVGTGWQTLLADLAIILFMITAAALSQANHEAAKKAASALAPTALAPTAPSQRATPLAVYRAGPGAPPLGQWLAAQQADPRQLLTIVAPYGAGAQARTLAQAEALAREAGAQGVAVRLVVEPGTGDTTATLAYDSAMARSLLGNVKPSSQGATP
ncbi:MAG TPA: hypothetical protein VF440_10515 [Novosphingobium sp.]